MKINRIIVQATRSAPHPACEGPVIVSALMLQADLEETDRLEDCVIRLQAKAEDLAERHLICFGKALEAYLGLFGQQPSSATLEAGILLAQECNRLGARARSTVAPTVKPGDFQ
jgi:hypothetical protein